MFLFVYVAVLLILLGASNALIASPPASAKGEEIRQLIDQGDSLVLTSPQMGSRKAPVSGPSDSKSAYDGANYMTCTTQDYSLETNPDQFVLFDPLASTIWPGALIQGKSLDPKVNSLMPLKADRAKGTLVLALASGSEATYTKEVPATTLGNVTQGLNDLLGQFKGAAPAQATFNYTKVYSQEQIAAELSANVSGVGWSGSTSMTFDQTKKGEHILVELRQKYYTIAFDAPHNPEDFFSHSANVNDLKRQMGPGNPPLYVDSVTYGRMFYLLFETSDMKMDLSATLKGAYKGAVDASGDAKAEYEKQLSSTTVKAYAIGGSAAGALKGITGVASGDKGFDAIWDFFTQGANFGPGSPGVPISYMLRKVSDNSTVRLSTTTKYTANQCTMNAIQCPPIRNELGNDYVFVAWNIPQSSVGTKYEFGGGSRHKYVFPRCYRIGWVGVRYVCAKDGDSSGKWQVSGQWDRDARCFDNGETNQDYMTYWTR